ncbi:hypothetical protein Trydic_g15267 [Trypoxylus dichotomus]
MEELITTANTGSSSEMSSFSDTHSSASSKNFPNAPEKSASAHPFDAPAKTTPPASRLVQLHVRSGKLTYASHVEASGRVDNSSDTVETLKTTFPTLTSPQKRTPTRKIFNAFRSDPTATENLPLRMCVSHKAHVPIEEKEGLSLALLPRNRTAGEAVYSMKRSALCAVRAGGKRCSGKSNAGKRNVSKSESDSSIYTELASVRGEDPIRAFEALREVQTDGLNDLRGSGTRKPVLPT